MPRAFIHVSSCDANKVCIYIYYVDEIVPHRSNDELRPKGIPELCLRDLLATWWVAPELQGRRLLSPHVKLDEPTPMIDPTIYHHSSGSKVSSHCEFCTLALRLRMPRGAFSLRQCRSHESNCLSKTESTNRCSSQSWWICAFVTFRVPASFSLWEARVYLPARKSPRNPLSKRRPCLLSRFNTEISSSRQGCRITRHCSIRTSPHNWHVESLFNYTPCSISVQRAQINLVNCRTIRRVFLK